MRLLCMTFPPNKRAQEATEYSQFCKVREEYSEWVSAVVRKDSDPLEEAIDLMVALDGRDGSCHQGARKGRRAR